MKFLFYKLFGLTYFFFKKMYHLYIYSKYRKQYNIHETFKFNGDGVFFHGDGEIIIGENSYIGRYSQIQSSYNYKVIIGNNCKIGAFFKIWTESSIVDYDYNKPDIPRKIGNIIIGDAVWIGANVLISPNILIGSNSIIGANSVVTKNVPENAVVGGVPAKIIRFKKL